MKKSISILFLLLSSSIAMAVVRLPAIIGSHMVLQQKSAVQLWGWSAPAEKITIQPSWDTASYTVVAGRGARWTALIKTPAAGGPYTIKIKGSNELLLEDVMIGEVWVCGGQSNMEWSADQGLKQAKEESPNATNGKIRFFYVPKSTSATPQDDVHARWVVCNPQDMLHFSTIGYFFGKQINASTGFPVGLINSNWGGTPAEVWTPEEIITRDPDLLHAAEKLTPTAWWPHIRGEAYNAMIYPLTQFSIAGAIWYQGESNVTTHFMYRRLFTSMIDSWRKGWGKTFPFYFVQIAPYTYGDTHINGAFLREAQTQSAAHPKTGMVVISDLVDDVKNIHPNLKKEVAVRLSNYALAETYGVKGLNYKSPTYATHAVEKESIRIQFKDVPTTLMSKGGELTDFFIAGADGVFVPAKAKIEEKTVLVSAKTVKDPVHVRFGFTNTAMPNLFSAEGLPVNLFRTDK
ncbi:MAG: sialate O-acetylesterase [Chitinophagaceae bacterium]|nr:sialate O-acetylesterase [Chitinophagaceae bacterium]